MFRSDRAQLGYAVVLVAGAVAFAVTTRPPGVPSPSPASAETAVAEAADAPNLGATVWGFP